MSLRSLSDPDHLPALDPRFLYERPASGLGPDTHPPRILLLYGSLRERSADETARRAAEDRSAGSRHRRRWRSFAEWKGRCSHG